MCTNLTTRVTRKCEQYGWKVVRLYEDGRVFSYYKDFSWRANRKHVAKSNWLGGPRENKISYDGVFHCFARRQDARRFKRNKLNCYSYENLAIIRLKLSGKVFNGITRGMYASNCNDLPAIVATEATWDGKFHR